MKRKLTALILAAAMAICAFDLSAFAENGEEPSENAAEQQTVDADTGSVYLYVLAPGEYESVGDNTRYRLL